MTPGSPRAVVRLRGHEPTEASIDCEPRPRKLRTTSGLIALLGFWLLIPIVVFIPPHVPWALIAFGCGIYFGYRKWVGEYVVLQFSGSCPRCGSPLSIKSGSLIRNPHSLDCFNCHHKPLLELT